MSKITLRTKVEAEIMLAREMSSHPSKGELFRIRRLEELVILLADVIDRMNENQIKQLKEENERLKNHYLDTDIDIAYLTKENEQLKNGIRDSIEWLELNKEMYPENWVVEDDETVKDLKELLNNKNKEQE